MKLAGASLLGAGLASCSSRAGKPSSQSGEKIQLVYQDWRTEWFPGMAQEMLEQFHAEHPNIRVFFTLDPSSDVFDEKMLADFSSGTAPDVFQGCCTFFPSWSQKGYALDLRPYVKDLDQATIQDWDPVQYKAFFRRDGAQFGLPKYHGALALYFNKDIFDRYQVEYPNERWSYEDYRVAMQRLTHTHGESNQFDQWGSMLDISWDRIQVHANAWGGHFVAPEDPTHSLIAAPQAMQSMEWIRARMWDEKIMAGPLDVQRLSLQDAFISGKVAMIEDGSWSLKAILSAAKFRVGVVPMPIGPARRVTLASTDGFGIYAGTKYPEAAWELLKFLTGKDYGRAMAKANLLQPARASLVDEWAGFVRSEFPNQAKELDPAVFAGGHLQGYSVVAEIFANQALAQRLVSAAWEKIFLLGKAPADIMTTVSQQIEEGQRGYSG